MSEDLWYNAMSVNNEKSNPPTRGGGEASFIQMLAGKKVSFFLSLKGLDPYTPPVSHVEKREMLFGV